MFNISLNHLIELVVINLFTKLIRKYYEDLKTHFLRYTKMFRRRIYIKAGRESIL